MKYFPVALGYYSSGVEVIMVENEIYSSRGYSSSGVEGFPVDE